MDNLEEFRKWMIREGKARGTIQQYLIYMRRMPSDPNERDDYLIENIERKNHNPIAVWKSYLEFLEINGHITTEEFFKLKRRYKYPKKRGNVSGNAIARKEWSKLIKSGCHAHARLAIYLGLKSALRNSEVRHLRVIDIDFNNRILKIREHKSIPEESQLAWVPKHSKDRDVPIDDDVVETLKKWITHTRPDNLGHPYVLWNPDPRAKPGPIGSRALQNWARKTGFNIKFRDLRRSCLTDALYRTNNPRVPQLIAGHSSLNTTTIYLGQDKEKAFDLFRNMT